MTTPTMTPTITTPASSGFGGGASFALGESAFGGAVSSGAPFGGDASAFASGSFGGDASAFGGSAFGGSAFGGSAFGGSAFVGSSSSEDP
jgi:hypothetical protein